jgi:hypothetical protein
MVHLDAQRSRRFFSCCSRSGRRTSAPVSCRRPGNSIGRRVNLGKVASHLEGYAACGATRRMSSGTEQVEVGDHDILRPIREHLTSAARRSGRCSYPYSRGCRCPLPEILRISARITAVLAALTLGRSLSVTEEMTGDVWQTTFPSPSRLVLWGCPRKGKPVARRGRKTTGLSPQEAAGLPKGDLHRTHFRSKTKFAPLHHRHFCRCGRGEVLPPGGPYGPRGIFCPPEVHIRGERRPRKRQTRREAGAQSHGPLTTRGSRVTERRTPMKPS